MIDPISRSILAFTDHISSQLDSLRDLLVCPECRGTFQWSPTQVTCRICARDYNIIDGIPILLPAASLTSYKDQQATSHDKQGTPDEQDFETVRPIRSPVFYGWLLSDKYRRSVIGLEHIVLDAIALVSCGGSGMDAHFLASNGACVISTDISIGAAARTRDRAKSFGLPILSVVADAEQLPLDNLSVDLAYVHDGLHHLEDPEVAITEMARIARRGISITEPAQAAATALAVKFGAAEAVEESGNHVRRFQLSEIQDLLRNLGFQSIRPHRYAMWYRHSPGYLVHILSRPGLQGFGKLILCLINRVIGSHGNKLTIQATRTTTN